MPVEPAAPGLFGAVADRGHAGLVVTIGGQAARVLYAGPAPGMVDGVFQINAAIPPGTPAKAAVIVRSGEFASQAWPLPE